VNEINVVVNMSDRDDYVNQPESSEISKLISDLILEMFSNNLIEGLFV